MYFISANFLDRSSEFRYLVWKQGEDWRTGIACRSLSAVNVRFLLSYEHQNSVAGFGCTVLALAENVMLFGEPLPETKKPDTPLSFDYNKFVRSGDREEVEKVASISLGEDGSITAKTHPIHAMSV